MKGWKKNVKEGLVGRTEVIKIGETYASLSAVTPPNKPGVKLRPAGSTTARFSQEERDAPGGEQRGGAGRVHLSVIKKKEETGTGDFRGGKKKKKKQKKQGEEMRRKG